MRKSPAALLARRFGEQHWRVGWKPGARRDQLYERSRRQVLGALAAQNARSRPRIARPAATRAASLLMWRELRYLALAIPLRKVALHHRRLGLPTSAGTHRRQ